MTVLDPPLLAERQLLRVPSDQTHGRVELGHHLDHQQSERAVAEDRNEGLALDGELAGRLNGRRDRLHEDRMVVVDGVGDGLEVCGGQDQPVCQAAVTALDAQNRPVAAVVDSGTP